METTQKTQPKITVTHIDFDTRLAIVSAGMNVLLDRHDTAGAHAAVTEIHDEILYAAPEPVLGNAVLARAADVIRERGWCRDAFQNDQGQVCAIGAIRIAVGGDAFGVGPNWVGMNDAVNVLRNRILEETGCHYEIQSWNDAQSDAESVLKLLY